VGGGAAASFVYDGDGRRVKATVNGVTSYYVGDYYEVSAGVVKKYCTAGGQRIAMRSGGTLSWLLNSSRSGRKAPPSRRHRIHLYSEYASANASTIGLMSSIIG
jgi:hypothetical protein